MLKKLTCVPSIPWPETAIRSRSLNHSSATSSAACARSGGGFKYPAV